MSEMTPKLATLARLRMALGDLHTFVDDRGQVDVDALTDAIAAVHDATTNNPRSLAAKVPRRF